MLDNPQKYYYRVRPVWARAAKIVSTRRRVKGYSYKRGKRKIRVKGYVRVLKRRTIVRRKKIALYRVQRLSPEQIKAGRRPKETFVREIAPPRFETFYDSRALGRKFFEGQISPYSLSNPASSDYDIPQEIAFKINDILKVRASVVVILEIYGKTRAGRRYFQTMLRFARNNYPGNEGQRVRDIWKTVVALIIHRARYLRLSASPERKRPKWERDFSKFDITRVVARYAL